MSKSTKNKIVGIFKAKKFMKGFTLLEIMVALLIFSIAMVAISGILVSFVKTNRSTKSVQKAMEDSEQAMNRMAKKIRTSTIVTPAGAGSSATLRILEFSENTAQPQCQEFRFNGSNIQYTDVAVVADKAACASASLGGYANLIDNSVTGNFIVTPSTATTIGKVTIVFRASQGTTEFPIQSTVSLRDYTEI